MFKLILLSIVVNIQYGHEVKSQRICRDIEVSNKIFSNCVYERTHYQNWMLVTFKRVDPVLGVEYYSVGYPEGMLHKIQGEYY
jgi:hypothetical protein